MLRITGTLSLINVQPSYIYIAEIVIGALGILVGLSSHPRRENPSQQKENDQLKQASFDQQRTENAQLKKEIEQLRKENYDQIKDGNDVSKQANEQLQKENDQLRKDIA